MECLANKTQYDCSSRKTVLGIHRWRKTKEKKIDISCSFKPRGYWFISNFEDTKFEGFITRTEIFRNVE